MKKLLGSALVFGMLMSAPSAHALFKMEIYDGSTTVTLSDGNADGIISCANCIANAGILASLALGGSKPALTPAEMDLNYALYSTSNLDLRIRLTDTGFTSPIGPLVTFYTDLAGNTNAGSSGINYKGYLDQSNAEFGTGTQIFDSGYLPGPFGTNFNGSYDMNTGAGPYSITLEVIIHHSRCSIGDLCLSSGDAILSTHVHDRDIPEPASMILLGLGMVGLRVVQRKRSAK